MGTLTVQYARIGVTSIEEDEGRYFWRFRNRTYNSQVELTEEQAARWVAKLRESQLAEGNPNRVASYFATKRDGMFVGGIEGEALEHLITLIKQAKAQKKGLVTFLWSNDRASGRGPRFSLTAAVARDREEQPDASVSRRPIGGGAPSGGSGSGRFAPPRRTSPLDRAFEEPAKVAAGGDDW